MQAAAAKRNSVLVKGRRGAQKISPHKLIFRNSFPYIIYIGSKTEAKVGEYGFAIRYPLRRMLVRWCKNKAKRLLCFFRNTIALFFIKGEAIWQATKR